MIDWLIDWLNNSFIDWLLIFLRDITMAMWMILIATVILSSRSDSLRHINSDNVLKYFSCWNLMTGSKWGLFVFLRWNKLCFIKCVLSFLTCMCCVQKLVKFRWDKIWKSCYSYRLVRWETHNQQVTMPMMCSSNVMMTDYKINFNWPLLIQWLLCLFDNNIFRGETVYLDCYVFDV